MLRRLSPFVLLLPLTVIAGCPADPVINEGEGEGADEGEGDGGEGEGGEGEGDAGEGEGEPPPPPPPNDTCATAEAIVSGVAKQGTTVGALDETGCNAGAILDPDTFEEIGQGGADVAYTFTTTEERGVRLSVSARQIDAILSLFADDSCGSAELPDDDRTCVDGGVGGDDESIVIGSLPPGTYFIVVESYDDPGDFTVNLELIEPFCIGDAIDEASFVDADGDEVTGNETAESANVLFSDQTIGSLSRNSDTSVAETALDVHLCDADVDYFILGHMGGTMSLTVTGENAVAELHQAVVDVDASELESRIVATEGDVVAGIPGTDVDVPAGFYYLKVTETADLTGSANVAYDVSVVHQCEADDIDIADATLDAFFEAQQAPVALPLDAPVERVICGADVDLIPIEVLFEGQLVLVFSGDVGRDVTVELVSFDVDNNEVPVVVASTDDQGANTQTVAADVVPGRYLARITGPGIVNTGAYNWTVTLPGLDGAPANDLCADAVVLDDGVLTGGRTVGAASEHIDAVCGIGFETEDDAANDVFFRFTLDAETATELTMNRLLGYNGTVSLFELPAAGCPGDLTALVPVEVDVDVPLCIAGGFFEQPATRARAVLPAGDYLVVVNDNDVFGDSGVFQLTRTSFPDGFPSACDETAIRDIELTGTTADPQVLDLEGADFTDGTLAPDEESGDCSFGARGNELVLRFTAPSGGTLNVQTSGLDVDTVVYLRTECRETTGEACNDEDEDGGTSLLVTEVTGGTEYFLVIDSFSADSPVEGDSVGVELVLTP